MVRTDFAPDGQFTHEDANALGRGLNDTGRNDAHRAWRRLASGFRPKNVSRRIDDAVTITSLAASHTLTNFGGQSQWRDANPWFNTPNAKLTALSYWGGTADTAPGANQQTGVTAKDINAYALEFAVTTHASAGAVCIQGFSSDAAADVLIEVDDRPIHEGFLTIGETGVVYLNLNVAALCRGRELRITLPSTFALFGILRDTTVIVTPPPKRRRRRIGLVCNSYGQSLASTNPAYQGSQAANLCTMLERRTDVDWWNFSQGSTGYRKPGTAGNNKSVFGSVDRVSALPTDLDGLVYFGTANDGDVYDASYQADVAATFAAAAVRCPNTPIVVVGVESGISFGYTTLLSVNNAIRAAALAAPNVAGFIDPYTEGWFYGTGSTDAWTGDGNFDIYLSPDKVHLAPDGIDAEAAILTERFIAL